MTTLIVAGLLVIAVLAIVAYVCVAMSSVMSEREREVVAPDQHPWFVQDITDKWDKYFLESAKEAHVDPRPMPGYPIHDPWCDVCAKEGNNQCSQCEQEE